MKSLTFRLARAAGAIPKLANVALVVAAALAIAPASAADVTRESRQVSGFDRVVLRAVGDLSISQGDSESLVVEAEARLLPQIRTEVRDRTLTIDIAGRGFSTREPVRYLLRLRKLSGLEVAGSGNATSAPLAAQRLQLVSSGSGSVRMAAIEADTLSVELTGAGDVAVGGGKVAVQEVRVDGSAQYDARALRARDTRVTVDGSGQAMLAAERTLAATIRGAGSLVYRGDPVVTRTIEGAGSIERDTAR
jgi:hypothetical protein